MSEDKEGTTGIGHTGYSKYDAANAPQENNGCNDQEQGDGVATEQSPESMYDGSAGSLEKAKGQ